MDFLDESGLSRLWNHFTSKLATKVTKVNGMGLSSNDYTTEDKNKLSGIQSGAQVNSVTSVNGQTGDVVINISDMTTDTGHNHDDRYYTEQEVDSKITDAKSTSNNYADSIKLDLLDGAGTDYDTFKDIETHIIALNDAIDLIENPPAPEVSLTSLGITATAAELNYVDGVTSNIQGQLNNLEYYIDDLYENGTDSSGGGSTSLSDLGITATAAEINKLDGVTASTTELNYVDGVTSNIQTQLNSTNNRIDAIIANGGTSGGSGTSSFGSVGSATQPVYFDNGIPVSTTYELNQNVPFDAQFTDTTYDVATSSQNGLMSASDKFKLDNTGKTLAQHLEEEPLVLSNLQFGESLPTNGVYGQIYFLRVGV